MLYDRRHTRLLAQFGGLWKQMPVFGGIFMIVMLSSAGLPGLNGFVGEFLILVGTFTHSSGMAEMGLTAGDGSTLSFMWWPQLMAALAATGVVLGAIYLLHLFQKLMFGPLTPRLDKTLPDLGTREIWTFVPLLVLIFVMGIYPKPFLKRMEPATDLFLKEFKTKFEASKDHVEGPPRRISTLAHRGQKVRAANLLLAKRQGGVK